MLKESVQIVKEYLQAVLNADAETLVQDTALFLSENVIFECGYPIKTISGRDSVAKNLWAPLKNAFHNIKLVPHIAMDGICEIEGKEWVSMTGVYAGNFSNDLYAIPATKNYAFLRYGHFFRVENGEITKAYVLFDYIQLMQYAGVDILPKMIGGNGDIQPPVTGDGFVWDVERDHNASKSSMKIVMSMLSQLLVTGDTTAGSQQEYWAKDMTWYGPSGIGTYHTLEGFKQYRNAFLNTFPNRDYGNHCGVISKNNYVSVVGWKGCLLYTSDAADE